MDTCVRAVCAGSAVEALTLGLVARALGPLRVDLAAFFLVAFGVLAGGVRCSWQQAVRHSVPYINHKNSNWTLHNTWSWSGFGLLK